MTRRNNTLLNIKSIYPSFKPAERRVADYVLRNPKRVVHVSITELAKAAKVSDATVVKFCKRLGYQGFQEFKILLAQDVVVRHTLVDGQLEQGDDPRTIKEKVFRANMNALQDTTQVLDDRALEQAVDALVQAREIHFYGLGSSGIVALDGEQKFSRIGRLASASIDAHMQITRAILLEPGDVAIGLSHSGETREIAEALETARECGATTIAITNHSSSSVAKIADLVLLTSGRGSLFSKEGIASRITQLATIDALFAAVALADLERSQEVLDKTTRIISQR